jgi:hypothetical protein
MDYNIDLHLLVPCRLSEDRVISDSAETKSEIEHFMKMLNVCNNSEFTNRYVRNLDRRSLGKHKVHVIDINGRHCSYPCFAIVSIHSNTRLAVVDIVVPEIKAGADRIVDFFRSKQLTIGDSSDNRLIDQWLLENYGLHTVGDHRSLVFSGTKLSDVEKVNLLAAESEPMGLIMSEDFHEMSTKNIAQYDTAEAYVSEITLLEINKEYKPELCDRLSEQAIEVFFIILLLLQDAAICNVEMMIENAISDECEYNGNSNTELHTLVVEMSKATRFFNPRNFYYPTVRLSSVKIAEKFGLPKQKKLMTENKLLLEQLIELNSMYVQAKENDIINVILIILAVIQVVPILFGGLEMICYTGIVSLACIVFIILFRRKQFNRMHNKTKGKA